MSSKKKSKSTTTDNQLTVTAGGGPPAAGSPASAAGSLAPPKERLARVTDAIPDAKVDKNMKIGERHSLSVTTLKNNKPYLAPVSFVVPATANVGDSLADVPLMPNGPLTPIKTCNIPVTKEMKAMKGKIRWSMPLQPMGSKKCMIPIEFELPANARVGKKIVVEFRQTGPPRDMPKTEQAAPPTEDLSAWFRKQFRFRMLPWAVTFLIVFYLLIKIYAVYSSPCALLGISGEITPKKVAKAYRGVSMCTHPDRLTGKGAVAQKDGEILFTRVSKAKDEISSYFARSGPSKHCTEHENCEKMEARLEPSAWVEKCDQVQSKVYRGGDKTKLLKELCPCSCFSKEPLESVSCFADSIEQQAYQLVFVELPEVMLQSTGEDMFTVAYDVGVSVKDYAYALVTLQEGVMATISSLLTLSLVWKFLLKPLIMFIGTGAVFKSFVSVPTSAIFAPVPTAYRLLVGPLMRWQVFAHGELLQGERKHLGGKLAGMGGPQDSDKTDTGDKAAAGAETADDNPTNSTADREADVSSLASAEGAAAAQLRNRKKKKVAKGVQDQTKNDVLMGRGIAGTKAGAVENDEEEEWAAEELPEQLRGWIERRPKRPTTQDQDRAALMGMRIPTTTTKWRLEGAKAIKFEFVLTLTKNVLPLLMVVATGEVYNGLIVSMIIGWLIRNQVPDMSMETLHFWLLIAGYFHTVLGMKGTQIEQSHELGQVITLEWQWTWKDVLALANVVQMGATFTSAAQLGNEPGFATSFGAGVAIRYYTHTWTVPIIGQFEPLNDLVNSVTNSVTDALPATVVFSTLDEVATSAGGGVGDCGGGPFRMLAGEYATPVSMVVKAFLLLLPTLHAAQWCLRVYRELSRNRGKKTKKIRTMMRVAVAAACVAQCACIVIHQFNGIQGDLAGFWMTCMLAAIWESIMATYDLRGNGRQLLYLIIFILL